ncbi:MAG: bifunctional precorrin-2 dehydrogenase/sirohydrochlorin ferrochelatase [Actinomycetota bacterium]|nr:MAG: precorrin-2 dehydrogenase / sirohydrochlorin ferrochelatase [Acidimicrobiaceae bacterium]
MAQLPRQIDDGYPIVVRLNGRRVLVVGGGPVALRKVGALLAAGASITVVSPEFVGGFESLSGVEQVRRCYEPADLDSAWLVVAATNDPVVQQRIFDDGERAGVWVNAVDDPERCSFILPAIERRGPVIVAVSTQGRSPTLAGQLRDHLAGCLPDDVAELAERMSDQRRQIQARGSVGDGRPIAG